MYTRIPDSRDILFLREHMGEGTLIDIGSNVGLVTLLLADKVQQILLFEPNPIAAHRARENLALNRLNFEVHEVALSDKSGTVGFEDEGGVSTCNRTVSGFYSSVRTREVQCIQRDEFLAQSALKYPICAVKIDVEGHENQVLAGMAGCLRNTRPRLVMFEYLQRTNLCESLRLFAGAEYKVFQLTSKGPEIAGPDVRHSRICSPVLTNC
jgi:FkbM family methyltransferase